MLLCAPTETVYFSNLFHFHLQVNSYSQSVDSGLRTVEEFLNNVSHPHQKYFNLVNIALALKFLKWIWCTSRSVVWECWSVQTWGFRGRSTFHSKSSHWGWETSKTHANSGSSGSELDTGKFEMLNHFLLLILAWVVLLLTWIA